MASHNVLKEQLSEMGFEDTLIVKALSLLGDKATMDSALEYIDRVMNGTAEEPEESTNSESKTDETKAEEQTEMRGQTEEEKQKKKEAYEEIMRQRRIEREAKEKEEELKREIKRREDGKGVGKMKEELEMLQRAKVAEDMRREKAEAKAARDSVLAQIARDREEQKRARQELSAPSQPVAPIMTSLLQSSGAAKEGKCRLAIRLLDGKQLINEFDGRESLSAVRVYVITQVHPESNFTFVMPPQQPFSDEDMEKPLNALGLCPSARIHVIRR